MAQQADLVPSIKLVVEFDQLLSVYVGDVLPSYGVGAYLLLDLEQDAPEVTEHLEHAVGFRDTFDKRRFLVYRVHLSGQFPEQEVYKLELSFRNLCECRLSSLEWVKITFILKHRCRLNTLDRLVSHLLRILWIGIWPQNFTCS
jgi:hypothetical protein